MTSSPQFSVEGKTAIVTGAGSGINYEFAKLLVARKCNVVIGDLVIRPEAQALIDENGSSPCVKFIKTDVTNWTDLSNLFEETIRQFGTFDIVCPGAGVFEPHWSNFWHPPGVADSASKDPVEGLGHYAVLDINLTHPIRSTQLALAEFLNPINHGLKATPDNPKRVVHVSSVACEGASLMYPMYIASKHAVTGFVRSLAGLEDEFGIRVNAVAPGLVRTPLWLDHPEKMPVIKEDDIWVTPEEVAEAMLKLVEDRDMLGGTILEVGHEHTRSIPLFGNEPPTGPGLKAGNAMKGIEEVHGLLRNEQWGKVKNT